MSVAELSEPMGVCLLKSVEVGPLQRLVVVVRHVSSLGEVKSGREEEQTMDARATGRVCPEKKFKKMSQALPASELRLSAKEKFRREVGEQADNIVKRGFENEKGSK